MQTTVSPLMFEKKETTTYDLAINAKILLRCFK